MNDPPQINIFPKIETRCLQTRLRLAPSSNSIIKELSFFSKNVYNCSLFAYSHYMKVHELQVLFYCDRFYEFVDNFSPSDRLVIAKRLSFLNEKEKLKTLIRSSHKSETELLKYAGEECYSQENANKEETYYTDFNTL
jgi:hypothetical protein